MLACIGVLLYPLTVVGQQVGRIEGQITSAVTNQPVPAVAVLIAGTRVGAVTAGSGRFMIPNVAVGAHDIEIQRIGYRPETRRVTVLAGETATLNIALIQTTIALDEVVVTGTAGVATRRDLGTSASTVGLADLELSPVLNISEQLSARVGGLFQFTREGQLGGGSTILLRGIKSVTQNNQPLIYIDGVRMSTAASIPRESGSPVPANPGTFGSQTVSNPLDELNPEDIDRIEVVKGAAATTLYGTEGAGGVIQIFTKRGRAQQAASWTARVTAGTRFVTGNNLGPVIGKIDDFLFLKPFLKRGPLAGANVSVQGGAAGALGYFLSAGYEFADGVVERNESQRWVARGNFTFEPAAAWRIDVNTSYSRKETQFIESGNNAWGFMLNVLRGGNCTGAGNLGQGGCGEAGRPQNFTGENGIEILYDIDNIAGSNHFVAGFTITHTPTVSLTNRFTLGLDDQRAHNLRELPFNFPLQPAGLRATNRYEHRTLTLDYIGTWSTQFGESLSSSLSWGGQMFTDWDDLLRGGAAEFPAPGPNTVSSGASSWAGEDFAKTVNAGFLLQEVLGVRDRLFVTGGFRIDGNSAFGGDMGLQLYPKGSVSYILSDHDFWPSWWPVMKLRAAVGSSGKAPGAFDALRTWDPVSGYEGLPGLSPLRVGDPNLGPERTAEIEVGFEAGLLNDRLGLDVSLYRSRTTDALLPVVEPPSQGFLANQLRNVGTLQNKGIEWTVSGTPIATDVLRWDLTANFSVTESEVVDLGGAPAFETDMGQWIREGYPINSFFGYKVMNPDEVAEPVIEADQYYGPIYPPTSVSLSTSINVARKLTLQARGEGFWGHQQTNHMVRQEARRGLWPQCNDREPLEEAEAIWQARCAANLGDVWTTPADYFKLRSISLTYQLPDRLIPGTSTAFLTVMGQNLWKWQRAPGIDPELTTYAGFPARWEYYQVPPSSLLSATLRVTF
jgi:TonB-dependent SusC/RagA subfamily outer membrane receptor